MSDQERTLQPTVRRRQMARAEGRVATSSHVTAVAIWLAGSLGLSWFGGRAFNLLTGLTEELWGSPWSSAGHQVATGVEQLQQALLRGSQVVLPIAILCFFVAVLGRLAQVGFIWAPQRIVPNLQRTNPASRMADLFSVAAIFSLVRGVGLVCAALGLLGWWLWTQAESLLRLSVVSDVEFPQLLLSILSAWSLRLGICLCVFAALDYAYQRYRYEASLQMSTEELRAEIQAVQGNPQVTAGRRDLRREILHRQ